MKTKRKRKSGKVSSAWIRNSTRWAIYLRDDFQCVFCGLPLDRDQLTLDHLYPRNDPRRTNRPEHLVTTCVSCNTSRKDTELEAYLLLCFPGKKTQIMHRITRQTQKPLQRLAAANLLPLLKPHSRRAFPTTPVPTSTPTTSEEGSHWVPTGIDGIPF